MQILNRHNIQVWVPYSGLFSYGRNRIVEHHPKIKTAQLFYRNNYRFNVTTVRVENFEVFLISRFSWVADATKIIHVEDKAKS